MKNISLLSFFVLFFNAVHSQIIVRNYDDLGRVVFEMFTDSSKVFTLYDEMGNVVGYRTEDPCDSKPRPQISTSSPLTFCEGDSVVLSISPGISFLWSTGDSTHTSITVAAGGAYSVSRLDSFPIVAISDTIQCYLTSDTLTVTVNPLPVITAVSDQSLCNGATSEPLVFSSSIGSTSYTWVNDNTSIGLAGSGTGSLPVFDATNLSALPISGIVIVTPSASGCEGVPDTFVITVNPTPGVDPVASQELCAGVNTMAVHFSSGTPATAFNWTNDNASIGLAASGTGDILSFTAANSGLTASVANINITPTANGCNGTPENFTITVNPNPPPVSGSGGICLGSSVVLSNAISGGTWTSSCSNVSIGLSSGIALGEIVGTSMITYTLVTGCSNSRTFTVNPLPPPITGANVVCAGYTLSLFNTVSGGSWTSADSTIATIDMMTGLLTGHTPGLVTISYTLPTGCLTTTIVTVNSYPSAIAGPPTVCVASTATLLNEVPGGTWTSSSPARATIDSVSGLVMGLAIGTTSITYSFGSGCEVYRVVTVLPSPSVISGVSEVCVGSSIVLGVSPTGGTWSSADEAIAVVSGTGMVEGAATGDVLIYYTLSNGCSRSKSVTVNPIPLPVSGTFSVCSGASTLLIDDSPGGTWSAYAGAILTVDATGLVTGVASGVALVTYTLSNGCFTTASVTANITPAPIIGTTAVCEGSMSGLHSTTSGGLWESGNPSIAVVGSSSGLVSGILSGTCTISYLLPTGCYRAIDFTVNPLPAPISAPSNVCVAGSSTLSSTPGGTWTCSPITKATVDLSTGVLTGIAPGSVFVTYHLPTGCTTITTVTVDPLPAAITNAGDVCKDEGRLLGCSSAGGVWASSDPAVADVSSTGLVTGVSVGIATITYTLPTACYRTVTIAVNPVPPAITGPSALCMGETGVMANAMPGGTWSVSPVSVCAIAVGSGSFTALHAGIGTISYTLASGCRATKSVTVNPLPALVEGPLALCNGDAVSYVDATPGGVWSSSDIAVATIGSISGNLHGIAEGVTNVSYALPTGCSATLIVTVNPVPAPISGVLSACVGAISELSNATLGGIWTTTGPSTILISAGAGFVTGLESGTAVVRYTLSTGCSAMSVFTVNPLPLPIDGENYMCEGTSATVSCPTIGGVWTSGAPSIASVGSGTGIIDGHIPGTTVITYTLPTGCIATRTATVFPYPEAISGATEMCQDGTIHLIDASPDGHWYCTDGAGIVSLLGDGGVYGVAPGTATITYALGSGCAVTTEVTILANPPAITGTFEVCPNTSTVYANAVSGGVWESSTPSIGTIASGTGVFTAIASGITTLTYTLPTGCYTTRTVSVYPTVAAIDGTVPFCEDGYITLSSSTVGGLWTSGDPGVASVGLVSGFVTGTGAGTTGITYTASTGCVSTAIVSVLPTPASIDGVVNICIGNTASLSDATSGGTWSSASPTVATIGSIDGVVTGVSAGFATISYQLAGGCLTTAITTVNADPPAIAGSTSLCLGSATLLTNPLSGGTWSSSGIATIGEETGLVVGSSVGTASITYSVDPGCFTSTMVTVHPLPSAISGVTTICVGQTASLSSGPFDGFWSSSSTSVATVGSSSGLVAGVAGGTSVISFADIHGCSVATTVTIAPLPAAIAGVAYMCIGGASTLTSATTGGIWSSSNLSIASVGSTSGIVSGLSIGTAVISYVTGPGCLVTKVVTVNSEPPGITGGTDVCIGATTTLHNTASGGSWYSSSPAVASIGVSSGVVTGISSGTATISYTLLSGCTSTYTVSVNATPPSIIGYPVLCVGDSTTLFNSEGGGVWTSADPSIASINSSSGVLTGVTGGVTRITYTLGTSCYVTRLATINALPATITGTETLCVGSSGTMYSAPSGGAWASGDPSVAVVSSSGVVTGVTDGSVNITYINSVGCRRVHAMVINESPSTIVGSTQVCVGETTTLSNSVPFGTWESSNIAKATINPSSGLLTGVAAGTSRITYTLPTGCRSISTVTVNPLPSSISGPSTVCEGGIITLGSSTSGGSWSSSAPAIGSIWSGSGTLFGITSGTITVSYVLPSGCLRTKPVTVNPLPVAGVISGSSVVVVGSTVALSASVIGGVWSSSAPGYATVSSVGVVTGVSPGSAIVSYDVTSSCGGASATFPMSVAASRTTDDFGGYENDLAEYLVIFPNPNSGSFVLEGRVVGSVTSGELFVIDVFGRTVYHANVGIFAQKIEEEVTLDRSLSNGSYMVRLVTDTHAQTVRFDLIR